MPLGASVMHPFKPLLRWPPAKPHRGFVWEAAAGCVVYSIGGNNQWRFEQDILAQTPCSVHTFDCTGPITRFRPPAHDRLYFHHVCLGAEHEDAVVTAKGCSKGDAGKCGPTWTLLEMQQNLGHKHVDLYKMDIEGFEWSIFESWPELFSTSSESTSSGRQVSLPLQLLVEVHYKTQFPVLWKPGMKSSDQVFKDPEEIVQLQEHLLRMGYIVVERDDNKFCPHCTELTLVRMKCSELASVIPKKELVAVGDSPKGL